MTKERGNTTNNLSILVIEDNVGDFVLVQDFLQEKLRDLEIIHAIDYESATRVLEERKKDLGLILIDLHLPDLSGIELIESILTKSLNIPVIILTGYSDLPLAKRSLKLGVYDFLVKDEIDPNLLHKSIEFALSRSSYVRKIETQNEKLKRIAWTQSHIVRAPLARILGILNLIENKNRSLDDIFLWLKHLRVSANELDDIIREIVNETQDIDLKR